MGYAHQMNAERPSLDSFTRPPACHHPSCDRMLPSYGKQSTHHRRYSQGRPEPGGRAPHTPDNPMDCSGLHHLAECVRHAWSRVWLMCDRPDARPGASFPRTCIKGQPAVVGGRHCIPAGVRRRFVLIPGSIHHRPASAVARVTGFAQRRPTRAARRGVPDGLRFLDKWGPRRPAGTAGGPANPMAFGRLLRSMRLRSPRFVARTLPGMRLVAMWA